MQGGTTALYGVQGLTVLTVLWQARRFRWRIRPRRGRGKAEGRGAIPGRG